MNGHLALAWTVEELGVYAARGLIVDLGDRLCQVTAIDDGADNEAEGLAFIASFTLTG